MFLTPFPNKKIAPPADAEGTIQYNRGTTLVQLEILKSSSGAVTGASRHDLSCDSGVNSASGFVKKLSV